MARSAAAGSSGEFQQIYPVPRLWPSVETGSAGVLSGLRGSGADLTLELRSGTAFDSRGELQLRDTSGQVIGGTSVTVEKTTSRRVSFADVFSGQTIPDDAVLEFSAVEGDLDIGVFSVDRLTGDVDYLTSQVSILDPPCIKPQISFVDTTSRNLAAAGDVTFSWSTSLASTVSLVPAAENLPASSSYTTRVSSSSVFRLVATNSCGETSATLSVSVGAPRLSSIFVPINPTATSAQPGQLFTINLDNVGDSSQLSGLVLRQGTSIEMTLPIEGFSDDGVPYARVPLLSDPTAPGGYRAGAFTLASIVSGKESAPIPFTIALLPVVSDPVTAFRAILDGVAAATQQAAAEFRDASVSTAAVQDLLTTAGILESDLRKVLSDIASTGRGSFTPGLRVPGGAPGTPVTVTRDDLALLVALNANYIASAAEVTFASKGKSASGDRSAGTCIDTKQPLIQKCKALEDAENGLWLLFDPHPQVFNVPELDAAFQRGRDAAIAYITRKVAESSLNLLMRKANLFLNWTRLVCALQPIRLKRFDVIPTDFQIGQPRGTAIRAVLVPKFKDKELTDALIKEETDRIMNQIPDKYKNLKPVIKPSVEAAVRGLIGDVDTEVANFIRKHLPGVANEAAYQVGKCDIARFYAKTNGPEEDKYDKYKAIIIPVYPHDPSWGRDQYIFDGRRRTVKHPETMCIQPFDGHFLFSAQVLDKFKQNPDLRGHACEFQSGPITTHSAARSASSGPNFDLIPTRVLVHTAEVTVDGGASLSVTRTEMNAWCVCEDENPTGITGIGDVFQGNEKITENNTVERSYSWRNSAASGRIKRISDTGWEIHLQTNAVRTGNQNRDFHDAIARIAVSFTNPPNRYNNQTIGIQVRSDTAGCQRPASFSGAVFNNAGFTNIVQAPSNPFRAFKQFYPGAERGSMTFTLGGELTGFNSVTTDCAITAVIDLYEGPPPAQPTP